MTDQAKHTPTPWMVDPEPLGDGYIVVPAVQPETGLIGAVCSVEKYEDAAFIVRACNAHDDLVEALQSVVNLFENQGRLNLTEAASIARAALKKAGE